MSNKARDQAYIKLSNIHSVLEVLIDAQPVSRKDLIGMTGMSPTSITRIIGALLGLSLVVEGESNGDIPGRGRKAVLLRTNPDGLYTLGFFIKRTHMRMVVLDFSDASLYQAEVVLEDRVHSPESLAAAALLLYKGMPGGIARNPSLVKGIGVSISGIVNHNTGVVTTSIEMRWQDVDVRSAFEQAFGMPVWVENDVKAALIGAKNKLGIPRLRDAAYLYLGGRGISTAVTAGGSLLRGERGAAGEIAHIVLTPGDLPCDCGKHGCVQLHLVESFLVRRAQNIDPMIRGIDGIVAAFRQKMAWAQVLIGDFQRHLQLIVSLLNSICDPAHIILCGDIINHLHPLLPNDLLPPNAVIDGDFEDASVRGTAILAMRHTLALRLEDTEAAR